MNWKPNGFRKATRRSGGHAAAGLAQIACPAWGSRTRRRKGSLAFPVHGPGVSVPGSDPWHCPKCREVILDFAQSRDLRRPALDIYRRKHQSTIGAGDLRTPEALRADTAGIYTALVTGCRAHLPLGIRPECAGRVDGCAAPASPRSPGVSLVPPHTRRLSSASRSTRPFLLPRSRRGPRRTVPAPTVFRLRRFGPRSHSA